MIRMLVLSFLLSATGQLAMAASPDAPSLKPPRVYSSSVTSSADVEILHDAFDAAKSRDWRRLKSLQQLASDQSVKDLILWMRATEGAPEMGFDEMASALDHLSRWPSSSKIQKNAEELIGDSALSTNQRIDWLTQHAPRTGPGKVIMADTLRLAGRSNDAERYIRDAWHNNTLPRSTASRIKKEYKNILTRADHEARTEFLLWTNQRSAASQMKPLLGNGYDRLVDARVALAARGRGVDSKVAAVPESLKNNPGLLYERARWRRTRARNMAGATPLLVGIDGAQIPEAGRKKLAKERTIHIRDDLKTGKWDRVYQLSASHGLHKGAEFAEAEWMAGWSALRLNDDPQKALGHFQKLATGVSTPISTTRAYYWEGRALDVLNRPAEAIAAYEKSAEHNYTYYGQLSSERLNTTTIDFSENVTPIDAEIASFNTKPLVKALRLIGGAGERGMYRKFSYHLDDQLTTSAEYELLSQLAGEYHIQDAGVRGAKAGLGKGVVAPDAAYPIVNYPLLREPNVERSLILALSRQESEMNPRARSHANARGLMQFIPATARLEARKRKLPYRTSWLTDDPGYNMTLGGQHLDTLLGQFNGSYIMAAAAYNAGPSRPKKWIKDYGDPRNGSIDPIDWVEFIPFSETRNYVQRVLENTQVYRHRLSGQPESIRLTEDLKRGG